MRPHDVRDEDLGSGKGVVGLKHLRLANGGEGAARAVRMAPSPFLCYIFIDWGDCNSIDQCGFDFADCASGGDICLIDY
jgi:hypothetical protein